MRNKVMWAVFCILILILSITAGCATTGTVQSNQRRDSSSFDAPASSAPNPTMSSPPQGQDTGPHLVQPATGGPPVMAIPLGGNMYLPVTGGEPVIGIPLGP